MSRSKAGEELKSKSPNTTPSAKSLTRTLDIPGMKCRVSSSRPSIPATPKGLPSTCYLSGSWLHYGLRMHTIELLFNKVFSLGSTRRKRCCN
ncbi:hypothetical protein NL676_002887 [Syzygium grande]|nr:hypothetical protein NL676_002887 [Syzygium grande]